MVNPLPAQARLGPGDPGRNRYRCSSCRIDYQVPQGRNAVCPLCEAKREMESLRGQIGAMATEQTALQQDLARTESFVKEVTAMREALALASPEDVAEIKAVAYRWRAAQDSVLVGVARVAIDHNGERRLRPVLRVGLDGREEGEDEFMPGSVGGVVFVESYEAALKSYGPDMAMKKYMQAVAPQLAT